MKKERVLYLDLIRITCFLMVTSYHFYMAVGALGIEATHIDAFCGFNDIKWSGIAVPCFFMISGAALIYQYGGGKDAKRLL